jgi:hypothetical protein
LIDARLNADWYRVKFNLAALHANWSTSLDDDDRECGEAKEHRQKAHLQAEELAKAALEQLVEGRGEADPALLGLLEKSILPSALILYSGTAPRPGAGEPHAHATEPPGNPRQLLDDLRTGLRPVEARRYVERSDLLTPRTLYNLACASAQAGDVEEGKDYLQRALSSGSKAERDQLAQRAASDPSLGPLREADVFSAPEPAHFQVSVQEAIDSVLETLFESKRYVVEEAPADAEAALAEEEAEEAEPSAEEEEENGPTATA